MSQEKESPKRKKSSIFTDLFFYLLLCSPLIVPFFIVDQPEPGAGTSVRGESVVMDPSQASLLVDQTLWDDQRNERVVRQEIFNTILKQIRSADRFIVADFFLWNPWTGKDDDAYKQLAEPLARALIQRKKANPKMPVLVITDPINRVYDTMAPAYFEEMKAAGIELVYTNLDKLPDSNWIYGTNARFYRQFVPGLDDEDSWVNKPRFSNPFDSAGEAISATQLGRLLFFKANHRKVLITGSEAKGLEVLVSSFNPADGSSAHSNLGVLLQGEVARTALESELGVASWSTDNADTTEAVSREIRARADRLAKPSIAEGEMSVQWISEGGIHECLLNVLAGAKSGDRLDVALFYLSDRDVVNGLKDAVKRGVKVRMLLDANRDAFGREKNGIPNRPVAGELMELAGEHSIDIRWADTHGEQFHPKALALYKDGQAGGVLLLGSANWTRRNLEDLNLEAGVCIRGADGLMKDFHQFYELSWNEGSLEYEAFAVEGWEARWKTLLYRVQEWSGLSTF